nr:transcriptional regulator [Halomarina sp. BND7]
MYIRYREGDEEGLLDALEAVDRGETPDPHFECVYRDAEDVHRVTRPKTLELLRVLVAERPDSIRETARLVDRDVRQVHRNLEELEALGLLDFEQVGRSKRPTVWYDRIEVDLPLNRPERQPARDRAGV